MPSLSPDSNSVLKRLGCISALNPSSGPTGHKAHSSDVSRASGPRDAAGTMAPSSGAARPAGGEPVTPRRSASSRAALACVRSCWNAVPYMRRMWAVSASGMESIICTYPTMNKEVNGQSPAPG